MSTDPELDTTVVSIEKFLKNVREHKNGRSFEETFDLAIAELHRMEKNLGELRSWNMADDDDEAYDAFIA